jgi:hypothetical protein
VMPVGRVGDVVHERRHRCWRHHCGGGGFRGGGFQAIGRTR